MKTLLSSLLVFNLAFAPLIAHAADFKAPVRVSLQAPILGRGAAKPVVVRRGPAVNLIEIPVNGESSTNFSAISSRERGAYYDRPTRKIWFVYSEEEDKAAAADALYRLRQELPKATIEFKTEDEVLAMKKDDEGKEHVDTEATFNNIAEGPDMVLASNQDLYESLGELREDGYAREIPMGFTTKHSISIDVPKADIDLHRLNDPRLFPHRNYLYITERNILTPPIEAGSHKLHGDKVFLEDAVQAEVGHHKTTGKKGDDDDYMGPLRLGVNYMMWRTGQADDKETAQIRKKAHALADYLEKKEIHVLVIETPEASSVVGMMKKMGYHVGLPVIWDGPNKAPADATGINLTLHYGEGEWLRQAEWVKISRSLDWKFTVAQATVLERLPYNFMEEGGPSILNAEASVKTAMEAALPVLSPDANVRTIGAELTNGNGVIKPGDGNAFGHLGMSFELEPGTHKVSTIWYNSGKGGPFSGVGSDARKALNLAEYAYTTQFIPEAPGQPTPIGETAGGSMLWMHTRRLDNRPVDKTSISDALQFLSHLDAEFQKGNDQYSFLNNVMDVFRRGKQAFTNCSSLVVKAWKKIGAALPDPLIQNPIDGAVNIFALIAREFKTNKTGPFDFMISSWERPYHSAPAHYRIDNRPIASPMYHGAEEALLDMNIFQRVYRYLQMLYYLPRAWRIPKAADAMADMAGVRIIVGPNSNVAKVYINPQSPVIQLRASDEKIEQIRAQRDQNSARMLELNRELVAFMGHEGWRNNPERLREKLDELVDPAQRKKKDEELAEHSRLEAKDTLYHLDELVELNRQLFLKIQLLDPLKRTATKLDPIKRAYEKVMEMHGQLAQGHDLSEEQIGELARLNAQVFKVLNKVADDVVARYGPLFPRAVRMMFAKTSSKDFEELLDLSQKVYKETASKKTGGKK